MSESEIGRAVASAVAWLDQSQVGDLLRLMVAERGCEAQGLIDRWVPDLPDDSALHDPRWRAAWIWELDYRASPPHTEEEPDAVATQEVPDYARYARVA